MRRSKAGRLISDQAFALGISATSAGIAVTSDAPPAISLTSPVNGATATAPAILTLTAKPISNDRFIL